MTATKEANVWLVNPPSPQGVNILGFISKDRFRIDLLADDKMEVKESLAKEVKKNFGFLKIKDFNAIADEEVEEIVRAVKVHKQGDTVHETPLAGMSGLGPATLEKLAKADIYTREVFFEILKTDPERIKNLIGNFIFKRFFEEK